VIFDRQTELPNCPQASIRFHRNHATEASDTIQVLHETRQVLPNAVSLAGWNYKTLAATSAQAQSALEQGEVPSLEVYDGSQAYRFETADAAQLRTDLLLAAFESGYRRFTGESTVRQLLEGCRFSLTEHLDYLGEAGQFPLGQSLLRP
jgi:type VI secretion system secreted protein VgrG